MNFKASLALRWLLFVMVLGFALASSSGSKCADFGRKRISGECDHTSVEMLFLNWPLNLHLNFADNLRSSIDNLTVTIGSCSLPFYVYPSKDDTKIQYQRTHPTTTFDKGVQISIFADQIQLMNPNDSVLSSPISCKLNTEREGGQLKVPVKWDASSKDKRIFLEVSSPPDTEVRWAPGADPNDNGQLLSKWWFWVLIVMGIVILIGLALSVLGISYLKRRKHSSKESQPSKVVVQKTPVEDVPVQNVAVDAVEQTAKSKIEEKKVLEVIDNKRPEVNEPVKSEINPRSKVEKTEDVQGGDLNLVRMPDRDKNSIRIQGF